MDINSLEQPGIPSSVLVQENILLVIVRKIMMTLLYFTPFGYILSLFGLMSGSKTPGVYIQMEEHKPFLVFIKEHPTIFDRFNWLINSIFLFSEAFYALHIYHYPSINKFLAAFEWIALCYATINFVTFLYPKFPWNEKMLGYPIRIIDIVIVVTLIFVVVYQAKTVTPFIR